MAGRSKARSGSSRATRRGAATRRSGPSRAKSVQAIQQSVGNQGLQSVLAEPGLQRCPEPGCDCPGPAVLPTLSRDAKPTTAPAGVALELRTALMGFVPDSGKVLSLLEGHDRTNRFQINVEFHKLVGRPLRSMLRGRMDSDSVVKAWALLEGSSVHAYETALALALIPTGTRDSELFRLLRKLKGNGKKRVEARYDRIYSGLGEGSLQKDLFDDLSEPELYEAIALLRRDTLTDADKLYIHGEGMTGTHEDTIVKIIQKAWDEKGPAGIDALEADWKLYANNEHSPKLSPRKWTGKSLYSSLDSELSGEPWKMVKTIFKAKDRANSLGVGKHSEPPERTEDDDQKSSKGTWTAEQEASLWLWENEQLVVLKDTIDAAADGAGTNESQVHRVIEKTRTIWANRIARAKAEDPPDQSRIAERERRWEEQRKRLLAIARGELSWIDADLQRAKLLLEGNLSPADELWLADEAHENDKVVAIATKYWAAGRIEELKAAATKPRKAPDGSVLRPAYDPQFSVPVTSGDPFTRLGYMLGSDQASAGAHRLHLELQEGDDNSDLERAYQFLCGGPMAGKDAVRDAVVATYVSRHLQPSKDPTAAFLAHIQRRYASSYAYWKWLDKLKPVTEADDPLEYVRRAKGRWTADNSGLLSGVLNTATGAWDSVTGEDTLTVAEESLARLEFLATKANAGSDEVAAMATIRGAKSIHDLAKLEYTDFVSRLDEVRALKKTIAEAIALAVELIVDAAITIASGGAAAAKFAATLGSAIAGIIAKELLLGQDNDMVSKESLQALTMAVSGQAFGKFGDTMFANLDEAVEAVTGAQKFMRAAAKEGISQIGQPMVGAMFNDRMPSVEDLIGGAVSGLGATLGSGVKARLAMKRLGRGLKRETAAIVRLRSHIVAEASGEIVAGLGDEVGLVIKEKGDLSGGEMAARLGIRTGKSLGKGVFTGLTTTATESVATAREDKKSKASAVEQDLAVIGAVNPETRKMLEENHELRKALAAHPRVVRALKLCASECLPSFATPKQITQLNEALAKLPVDEHGAPPTTALKPWLHDAKDVAQLGAKIDLLHAAAAHHQQLANSKKGLPEGGISIAARIAQGGKPPPYVHDNPRAYFYFPGTSSYQRIAGSRLKKVDRPRLVSGKDATRLDGSRLRVFNEGIHVDSMKAKHDELVGTKGRARRDAGNEYQHIVAADLRGEDVQEKFAREGRRPDIGTNHEVTLAGQDRPFGKHKLDQFWLDLRDTGKILLTCPQLHEKAHDQLARLGAQAEAAFDKKVMIIVRQTAAP